MRITSFSIDNRVSWANFRNATMETSRILITCPKGIPPILKAELESCSFPILSELVAGVETQGGWDDALRLNLCLRTGQRVLFLLREFSARNSDELYRSAIDIPWETIVPTDGYVCVTSSVSTASITDTRYASLRCKDAIVDRIRNATSRRPDSGGERNRTVVHLYWNDDRGAIYLDTSGEPLSRRSYRKIPLAAPMQETLAAAVVLATGWTGESLFLNPMCGSGTLAIEAALLALRRAPGLLRGNFGFMHVKKFDAAQWNSLRDEVRRAARDSFPGRIIATDIDPRAIEAAKQNARTAGVEQHIEFSVCDFADSPVPAEQGVLVMNPEYGERMGEVAALEVEYKRIGDFLKQRCRGYTGYVFTGNAALAKKVGLKPKRSLPFFNSGIECRLLEYDLYEGSKKKKKNSV
jgi:23S rRNA G2445 N2-methylase RlmL